MDDKLLAVLIGTMAGMAGYWITTFWMKPILFYRDLKTKVFADLIFYAQVINADGLNDRMKKMFEERVFANRRSAADLAACLLELPAWYRWYLRVRGQRPEAAVTDLIGYSNTTEYKAADDRIERIKRSLGLNSELP